MKNTPIDTAPDPAQELTQLSLAATGLGKETVDIGGFLDELDGRCQAQLDTLQRVTQTATRLSGSSETVLSAVQNMASAADQAMERVQHSIQFIQNTAESSQDLAQWVRGIDSESETVEDLLEGVKKSNMLITDIASQVHILSINAKVEAARAGQAGKGFSIVADSVKSLSQKTADAAETINTTVAQLSEWISQLHRSAQKSAKQAEQVITRSSETDKVMGEIQDGIASLQCGSHQLMQEAETSKHDADETNMAVEQISASVREVAAGVDEAGSRCQTLVDTSEAILQHSVALGGNGADGAMITLIQDLAGQVTHQFEAALSAGRISTDHLFSSDYRAIPGTNPQQVLSPFTALTDRILPAIQEPVLDMDDRIVFCAAIDRNGYLPTHNLKFSKPQGDDPIKNAAESRNRRIFDDRVGLKSGRNTKPFLLQVYRRDMGGGAFVLMKDLSAPIFVQGRHWGGLRMGYKF